MSSASCVRSLPHPTVPPAEYTILWKWDEESVEGLPANVVLSRWLPQQVLGARTRAAAQDILAHPNLRAFVTHGGLLSLQEALYHRTPLVRSQCSAS